MKCELCITETRNLKDMNNHWLAKHRVEYWLIVPEVAYQILKAVTG